MFCLIVCISLCHLFKSFVLSKLFKSVFVISTQGKIIAAFDNVYILRLGLDFCLHCVCLSSILSYLDYVYLMILYKIPFYALLCIL